MSAHTIKAAPLSASIGTGIIIAIGVTVNPNMCIPLSKEVTGSMRATERPTKDIPMILSWSGSVVVPDEQSDVLIMSFYSVV